MRKTPTVIKIPVRVKKPRCKEYDAAQRVLDYFNSQFENDNFDDIYQHDLIFGIGDVRADITVYPETWEIMEAALLAVQEFLKEEYADDYDFSPLKK